MHPMIRHPAASPRVGARRPGFAVAVLATFAAVALLGGCGGTQKPQLPQPRYSNLGLKSVPPYLKDTLLERTDVMNTQPLPVSSYGLVVNLRHSGDSKAPPTVRDWMVKEMYRHGIDSATMPGYENVKPEQLLSDPRTAIVMVGAYLPPGSRRGQRVDVIVQALPGSNTASLAGGQLWSCDLRLRGVDPINPAGSVHKFIMAKGPVFINPALALEVPQPNDTGGRTGARFGTIIGGGQVTFDRPITLRNRTPQYATSRAIETVINSRFQDKTVAAAQDEGLINLQVPLKYRGNWQHFVGVVSHLYINQTPAKAALKAQELVEEAKQPGAWLENISYALEALGPVALPYLTSLLAHPAGDVQYAAARAGAFIGDHTSEDALMRIATTTGHPYRINAIAALGELPNNSVINHALVRCLDSDEAQVRIEAYRILAESNDPNIFSYVVNNSYVVDEVRSAGKPMIYASRTGKPRLAIFGNRPKLSLPLTFTAFDHQLSIASDAEGRNQVSIFYRGPEFQQPITTASGTTVVELAARLGGAGTEGGLARGLRFGYGEVVAVLQSLVDSGKVSASFVMQDLESSPEDFEDTPGTREVSAESESGLASAPVGRPVGNPENGNGHTPVAMPNKPANPGVGAPGGRRN